MRQRSHWGWGWEDRFPDAATREALGKVVAALLGIPAPTPEEPVPLGEADVRAPTLTTPADLAAFCTDDRAVRARHTYGRAYRDLVRGFRGDFRGAPDLVALPRTEDDVAAVLGWASAAGVAVVPWGGGTSVVGGVECMSADHAGVITLDLTRLDRVMEVDEVSLAARIQAGATGPVIEEQLGARGLTLRHFPQSFEFSTLGGWIATRAGGHFATVYTHVDDLVESVRMVTPRGPWESRRLPGSGAGPSPDRLVLGSEGTLGVITEAWMRVRPRPTHKLSASVRFRDFAAAVDATRVIAQAGLYPTNCRLLDAREAMLHQVGTTNVLLLGFESTGATREPWMAEALALCAARGGSSSEVRRDDETATWRAAFLDAPYRQSVLVSLGIVADTFETACPWDRFEALHARVIGATREAMRSVAGGGLVSCRFTHVYPDGPAPYYTFLFAGRRGDELAQWQAVKTAASDALLAAGGTITHHHAVGRTHLPWAQAQRPALFGEALAAAKAILDPAGVLNPGALI
ncbi:MAG: alkyldihydroxyacetonephosphate synthase [Myxococcales bacterium]